MKIQYISDLHLEFAENREFLRENPIIPSADYLCIAGDTGYLTNRRKNHLFEKYADSLFDFCSKNWKQTFVIPGNHEWYGGYPYLKTPTKYSIFPNVTFLNNKCINIETDEDYDLTIYGGTLWSQIPEVDYCAVMGGMNDYKCIRYSSNVCFTVGLSNEAHMQAKLRIKALLDKRQRLRESKPHKLVIVTHHACHPDCILDKYNGSTLNSAYYTDLRDVIVQLEPEAWIFGHTHATNSFIFNNTIIAENCLGYSWYGTNFKPDQTINI